MKSVYKTPNIYSLSGFRLKDRNSFQLFYVKGRCKAHKYSNEVREDHFPLIPVQSFLHSYICFIVLAEFNHYEVFWGKKQCFVQEVTEKCFTTPIVHYVPAAIEAKIFLKTRKVFCSHSSTHTSVVNQHFKYLVRLVAAVACRGKAKFSMTCFCVELMK